MQRSIQLEIAYLNAAASAEVRRSVALSLWVPELFGSGPRPAVDLGDVRRLFEPNLSTMVYTSGGCFYRKTSIPSHIHEVARGVPAHTAVEQVVQRLSKELQGLVNHDGDVFKRVPQPTLLLSSSAEGKVATASGASDGVGLAYLSLLTSRATGELRSRIVESVEGIHVIDAGELLAWPSARSIRAEQARRVLAGLAIDRLPSRVEGARTSGPAPSTLVISEWEILPDAMIDAAPRSYRDWLQTRISTELVQEDAEFSL